MNLAKIRKSLVAAGMAGLFAGAAALGVGFTSGGSLSGAEAGLAVGATLTAAAATGRAVWAAKNAV